MKTKYYKSESNSAHFKPNVLTLYFSVTGNLVTRFSFDFSNVSSTPEVFVVGNEEYFRNQCGGEFPEISEAEYLLATIG